MSEREYEWAVRIQTPITTTDAEGGQTEIPGPHLLECSSERAAWKRLEWWEANRPEGRPKLVRREVITTFGAWEDA